MCKGISRPQMCWHMKLCQMSHKLEIYTNICYFWYIIIKCSDLHLCPMIDQEKKQNIALSLLSCQKKRNCPCCQPSLYTLRVATYWWGVQNCQRSVLFGEWADAPQGTRIEVLVREIESSTLHIMVISLVFMP